VCVCVCVCARVCVPCMRVCVCVRARARVCCAGNRDTYVKVQYDSVTNSSHQCQNLNKPYFYVITLVCGIITVCTRKPGETMDNP